MTVLEGTPLDVAAPGSWRVEGRYAYELLASRRGDDQAGGTAPDSASIGAQVRAL